MEARLPNLEPKPLVIADLVIDRSLGRAWRGQRRLRLTPRELEVLEILAENVDRVVSRDDIYRNAWGPEHEPTSNLVDATISHLRGKVDWGHRLRLIHTARGSGYVLSVDPEVARNH